VVSGTADLTERLTRDFDAAIAEAGHGWRNQLLQAAEVGVVARMVGAAVGEAVAARQTLLSEAFAGLRASGIQVTLPIRDTAAHLVALQSQLGPAYQEQLTRASETNRALFQAFRGVSRAAARDWATRWRALSERQRADAQGLQADGWPLIPDWPVSTPSRLVALRRREGKRALDRAICDLYRANRHRALRGQVDAWKALPGFRERKSVIAEALALHREGRYKSSIPTLLPHIEGILVDVFAPGSGLVKVPDLYRQNLAPERAQSLLTEGLIASLEAVYGFTPFATTKPRGQRLHRHAILHGRVVRYATEANSLRVFFMLDLIASDVRARASESTQPGLAR